MSTFLDLEALLAAQGDHSIFAPSAAHRWLECPGSLIPSLLADNPAGYDAAWGTVGHELAEQWLVAGVRPEHRLGEIVTIEQDTETFEIEVSKSMFRHVGRYVEWVSKLPGDHYTEQRVYFSQLTPIPKQGGTADYAALSPGILRIRDLKLGIHIQVFAERNPQAMIYALGVYYEWDWLYDFKTISIGIGQPRLDHWDIWECSVEELLEFAEYVRKQAAIAWSPNAYRKVGKKQCQFCPVKGECPALLKDVESLAMREWDEMGKVVAVQEQHEIIESNRVAVGKLPSPYSLTTEQMVKLMDYRLPIENFFKAIETRLNNVAQRGEEIPGKKLVRSRANRVFNNQREAADLLEVYGLSEEQLYSKRMQSPKQVAEALADLGYSDESIDDLFKTIVFKPQGKPTLVDENDSRPSISEEVDEIFGDLAGFDSDNAFDDLAQEDLNDL